MKKLISLIIIFLSISSSYAQISVGIRHATKKISKHSSKRIEKFKKTTTVFVLPNKYNTEEYSKILNETWTVTPFKVVKFDDFERMEYLSDDYSFFLITYRLATHEARSSYNVFSSLYLHLNLMVQYEESINEKINELDSSKENYLKKVAGIVNGYTVGIGRVELHGKSSFIGGSGIANASYHFSNKHFKEDAPSYIKAMYEEDVFYNYNLGFLKNYFQKLNDLLTKDETYTIYEDSFLKELSNLKNNKLYIPANLTVHFNAKKIVDSEINNEKMLERFKKYQYDYEIIGDETLSDKILSNEEFYYLRKSRNNPTTILNIVNSKTGEIVYNSYVDYYNVREKHIEDINKAIEKASKKK